MRAWGIPFLSMWSSLFEAGIGIKIFLLKSQKLFLTIKMYFNGFYFFYVPLYMLHHSGHYTGTYSTDEAKATGLPIWSSEDYSTNYDLRGTGCMARVSRQ